MSPWTLLLSLDAARQIALWCILGGWLTGAGVVVAFGWRRLTAPQRPEQVRLLVACHEDQRRQLEARLADAALQIRELLSQNARLAALYTVAKAEVTREVGRAMAGNGAA